MNQKILDSTSTELVEIAQTLHLTNRLNDHRRRILGVPMFDFVDFVLDAPNGDRYTYFFAFYGQEYKHRTGVLYVQHDFGASVKDLHVLIRQRINEVLGAETPSCYHIIALASPDPIPCEASI